MEDYSDFGSPVRTCKKCKGKYLDGRYHEIAIDGIGASMSVKRSGKTALIGFGIFLVTFLFNLVMVILDGKYNPEMVLLQAFALIIIFSALVDAIMIKTGIKGKQLEKKRIESDKRLKDIRYARMLAEFGYDVPEEYLRV